jgi:hypothetical protein
VQLTVCGIGVCPEHAVCLHKGKQANSIENVWKKLSIYSMYKHTDDCKKRIINKERKESARNKHERNEERKRGKNEGEKDKTDGRNVL